MLSASPAPTSLGDDRLRDALGVAAAAPEVVEAVPVRVTKWSTTAPGTDTMRAVGVARTHPDAELGLLAPAGDAPTRPTGRESARPRQTTASERHVGADHVADSGPPGMPHVGAPDHPVELRREPAGGRSPTAGSPPHRRPRLRVRERRGERSSQPGSATASSSRNATTAPVAPRHPCSGRRRGREPYPVGEDDDTPVPTRSSRAPHGQRVVVVDDQDDLIRRPALTSQGLDGGREVTPPLLGEGADHDGDRERTARCPMPSPFVRSVSVAGIPAQRGRGICHQAAVRLGSRRRRPRHRELRGLGPR